MIEENEINFVTQCISQWMRICQDNDYSIGPSDPEHSALLRRLLSGKEPQKIPPPVRFGHPDYDLGDGKEVEIHVFFETDNSVCIDQCSRWSWFDKSKRIVLYNYTNELYILREDHNRTFLKKYDELNS